MDDARHEDRRRGVRPPMYRITGHYPIVSPNVVDPGKQNRS
jgi:hypothetical protein